MTEDKPSPHTKLFLLVFHGGMVLYLIGHNVGIPLIRNLGMGNPIYYDVELFWALQVIIFWQFTKYDFDKPTKSPIPILIYITFYSTLMAIIELIFQASDSKVTLSLFAPFISLASLSIFLGVFFVQFKKYFLWDSKNVFLRHFFALMFGFAMFASRNAFLVNPQTKKITREQKEIPTFEEGGCKGSKISLSLPLKEELPRNSEILTCGFNFNLVNLNHPDVISVKNSLGHPIHVRLDFLQGQTFIFKRIQVLKDGEVFNFPKENSYEDGIYRLMTPSNPRLGIQIILKGDLKNLKRGDYLITPKKMEIKNESK
jgi:hypothetical protein